MPNPVRSMRTPLATALVAVAVLQLSACAPAVVDPASVQAQPYAPEPTQVPLVHVPYDPRFPRYVVAVEPLALQADVTRVISFQLARETSNRTYPEIDVPDPHHPLTHNGGDPEKLAKVAKINAFHVSLFAYFLEKLASTPDGDGSLLDHALYLYGSGMGNPDVHDHTNLPIIVAGGGGG